MRIPDSLLKCITFIGLKADHQIVYRGTGVFVVKEHVNKNVPFCFGYLVTAKHIADAVKDSVFYVRVNMRATGNAEDVPMNWEPQKPTVWYTHPTDPDADIAVTPVTVPEKVDALCLPSTMIVSEGTRTDLNLGVGDEVSMIGLFSHLKGASRNIPIVRTGNIAMFPDEKIPARDHRGHRKEIDAFIIEARSIGGMSGSPVVARQSIRVEGFHRKDINTDASIIAYSSDFHLVGLVTAHWDADPADINVPAPKMVATGVNFGLAIVVPSHKLLEILEGPELSAMRLNSDFEAAHKEESRLRDAAEKRNQ